MNNYSYLKKHLVSRQAVFFAITLLLCISFVSGSLGTYQKSETYNIIINSNQSSLNITILYPNSTIAIDNQAMGKDGFVYNYSFDNAETIGVYRILYCSPTGVCDEDSFNITGTGYEFNLQRTIFYLGILGIFVFLFVLSLGVTVFLPAGNNRDEEGVLISINQLKYLRPILYVVSYFILTSIVYISSNISLAYLGSTLVGDLLFKIFYVMFALTIPMLMIWFAYMLANIFQDREMKRYIERGLIDESI